MKSRLLSALLVSLSCGSLYAQPGVYQVLDACPNGCSSMSQNFYSAGGKVYYSSDVPDNMLGAELWMTDGTPGGTKMVKDINPSPTFGSGTESSDPTGFMEMGGKVYFAAIDDPSFDYKLYVTDGTDIGTTMVSSIPVQTIPNSGFSPEPAKVFHQYKGKLYFNARGTFGVSELWVTDGTSAGTIRVRDLASIERAHDFVTLNDKMYFILDDQGLMQSDGTEAGTIAVKNMTASNLTVHAGKLFFTGFDGNGSELWTSDGTDAGTVLYKDINPGASSATPRNLTVYNNKMYFICNNDVWVVDSAGTNPMLVKKFANPIPYRINANTSLVPMNGKMYFLVNQLSSGNMFLASTDGTDAGTTVITNKVMAVNTVMMPFNGKMYFSGFTPTSGMPILCYTDGTDAGTKAVWPNLMVGNFNMHHAYTNNDLYLGADDMESGEEVWRITQFNTAVNEVSKSNVAIYPNPATNVLNIETGSNEATTIRVMAITGQTMMQQTVNAAKATVEVSQLPAGTYFMHITTKGNTTVEKFVKQ